MPDTLDEALDALTLDGARILSGGTDVYPAMQRGRTPTRLVDVTRVAELAAITTETDVIRIGAAATWTQVIKADLPPAFDALKQAAREVGSLQIQNAATVAGNLCNASPAADGVPPLLALDASVELRSAARGARVLPLPNFLLGPRQTALAPDEIVTSILVPTPTGDMRSAFEKLGSRRYLVISICMVAATLRIGAEGRITEARIAVGACSPVARRLATLEEDLRGSQTDTVEVKPEHLAPLAPIDDVRATAAYRTDAAAVLIARAIRRAAQ